MSPPVIIPKKLWSGRSYVPWKTGGLEHPVRRVFFCVTLTEMCFTQVSCTNTIFKIKENDRYCKERKGRDPDVPYNFMIGGDGYTYEGRGWKTCPRLPQNFKKFSNRSLLIAFIGSFRRNPPSFKMFDARDGLIRYGIENDYIYNQYLPSDLR